MSATVQFSVIIPLYNKAPHIARAIDSVLSQSCPPHEVIVIDDASRDGGGNIAQGYARRGIKLLHRNIPGPGGYAARNMGIATATGEWIAFLDADDVWHADHLEVLARAIADAPTAGIVASRYDHIFADRREPDHVAASLRSGVAHLDFLAFLGAWLESGHCPVWTGAVAIRRDIFSLSGVFPEGRAVRGGDKDLWLRVIRNTPLAFVGQSTSDFYRVADNKVTDMTDTRTLPCMVETARALTDHATAAERKLLKRLINQEIALYARWTARSGGRPTIGLRQLAYPVSASVLFTLLAARYVPGRLLKAAYALEQSRRAWLRSLRA